MSEKNAKLSSEQFIRYARQIMLEDWGEKTQIQLSSRHVVIVGAGGLGNIAASYLAGAGVGKLTIIDGDDVELSNLPRQIAFGLSSIDSAKVYELVDRLADQNDQIELVGHHQYINAENAGKLLSDSDLVLDCTDNFQTRHLINRICINQKIPLLSASVVNWQGQLLLIDPRHLQQGCYSCLFPDTHHSMHENNCRTLGVVGPMVGVLASLQATQALRFLTVGSSDLASKFFCINGSDLSVQYYTRSRNAQCEICSESVGAMNNESNWTEDATGEF